MLSAKKRLGKMPAMQVNKHSRERAGKIAACALLLALACLLATACSSGPKVINLGGSASRVTIESH